MPEQKKNLYKENALKYSQIYLDIEQIKRRVESEIERAKERRRKSLR